jgi:hypothetical protein
VIVLIRLVCIGAVLALCAVTTYPWIDPSFGYFVDDGQNHAIRLYVFDHLLRRGAPLLPRWWQDLGLGYGSPLLNYYSPGTYYLGELAHLLGASLYRSLQWVGALAVFSGGIGAYLLGDRLLRHPLAGLVTAVSYVGAPYPFVTNLYQRSALPEALGLATVPWVLLAAWRCVDGRGWRAVSLCAVALASTFLMHNLSALIISAALVPWMGAAVLNLPRPQRPEGLRRGAAGIALGLALSAVLWLPVLGERGAVHSELGNVGNLSPVRSLWHPFRDGITLQDLAAPVPYEVTQGAPVDLHWTYPHARHSLPGPAKPSLAQGLMLIVTVAAGVTGWLLSRRSTQPRALTKLAAPAGSALSGPLLMASACVLLMAGAYFLQTVWARLFWEHAPLLPAVQFPWRLLGVLSLALAAACAAVFTWLSRQGQQQWLLALLLAAFVAVNGIAERAKPDRYGVPLVVPPWSQQLRNSGGNQLGAGTLTGGEFVPRSVTFSTLVDLSRGGRADYEGPFPPGGWIAGRVWPYQGPLDVQQVWDGPDWIEALVSVPSDSRATLAFRTLVFPGMRAYVDGIPVAMKPAPFDPDSAIGHGFALVDVPPGSHRVQVAFGSTVWRTLGTMLSILGAAITLYVLLGKRGPSVSIRSTTVPLVTVGVLAATSVAALWLIGTSLLETFRAPRIATATQASIVGTFLDPGGRVQFSSPAGSALGSFIDIRDITIDGHTRKWLYMHPPAEARLELDLPARAVFQAGLALDESAWDAPGTDGVQFQLEVRDAQGRTHLLMDESVQPQTRGTDRGWRFGQADLGPFTGQRVTIVLRTLGRDTPALDWAGWATPTIYVDRSALYPPPTAVAPARRRLP